MRVRKRLVLNFTGYEDLYPDAIRDRYLAAAADFDRLWLTHTTAEAMIPEGAGIAAMRVVTDSADWRTEVEFCQFGWADVFDLYDARPSAVRFFTGFRAFADILLTGTLWRYLRTSWRFVLFFLWPFVLSLTLLVLVVGVALSPVAFGGPMWNLLWSTPVAILLGGMLMRWPGRKLFLSYLLDDWSQARDRIHCANPVFTERRRAFAEALARKLRETDADEVVILAHSLGTASAVEAIADVFRAAPAFFRRVPVSLLAVGSCLLMLALHPKAKALREDVRLVLEDAPVLWAEFQALTDIIHFYKSDPAGSLGIAPAQEPVVMRIGFKQVHSDARYKRAKGNFFRMHLLFLKGAQKRNPYDVMMFQQGPFALRDMMTTYRGRPAPLGADGRIGV